TSCCFNSIAIPDPPSRVARGKVAVALEQAGGAIDELAHDVRMTGMPLSLGGDVHHDAVERDIAVFTPPRNMTHRLQRQLVDCSVSDLPGAAIASDNLVSSLVRRGPHACVDL